MLAVATVFDAYPDEAGDLWDEPEEECDPGASTARPALGVEEFAVGDDEGDDD